MNEVTKPTHTPTVAALEAMNVGVRNALTSHYFEQIFEHEPANALKAYSLFAELPRALLVYNKHALTSPSHARMALEVVSQHEEIPNSVPLMLSINETYPKMLAKFTSVRAITSPEVIAAMVKSRGKVDIATGSEQVDRVKEALANIMEEPQRRVGEVHNKGAIINKSHARGTHE